MRSGAIALLILLLVVAAAYVIFEQNASGGAGAGAGGQTNESGWPVPREPIHRLSVSPSHPLAGQSVEVSALMGDCPRPNTQLLLDGRPVSFDWSADGSGLSTKLSPMAGTHRLQLNNSRPDCADAVDVDVEILQCGAGQNASCLLASSACPGVKTCQEGRWGVCEPAPPVCRPGERVPCSSDSCAFGVAVCNRCANGWSACVPAEVADRALGK